MTRLAMVALFACGAGPAMAACEGVLPPGLVSGPLRSLTASDLLAIREVGQPDASTFGVASPFGLSPDRRRIAFVVTRVDPVDMVPCRGVVVLDLRAPGAPRLIDRGGEPILARANVRGAMIAQGAPKIVTPSWAPDGAHVAYLRRDRGVVQAWVAAVDGHGARAVTHSAIPIDAAAWTADGTGLIVATRPGATAAEAAVEREGRSGWLYDQRVWNDPGPRPHYEGDFPRIVTVVDLAGGAARPANAAEQARLGPEQPDIPVAEPGDRAGDGRRAWTRHRDATPLSPRQIVVTYPGGPDLVCAAEPCTGKILNLWWDGPDLLFLRREGWANGSLALYRWRPRARRATRILATDDVLQGCVAAAPGLVCPRETSRTPRSIVLVDRHSGAVRPLLDLNPEFRTIRLGTVERLKWRNAFGLEAWGDLVLPPDHRKGQRAPLIVVQYHSDGFLRGGTGDEYPIFLFAQHGMAVLSTERPASYATSLPDLKTWDAIIAANEKDWRERRSLLSSVLTGVDLAIARGVAAPDRLGITGLSDGATTVEYALINAPRFAAAVVSSCCMGPNTVMTYGGTAWADWLRGLGYPGATQFDPDFWKPMSLAQNADRIDTPLLMQVADSEYPLSLEAYGALRERKRPVELYVFPDEYHDKVDPLHRLAVYQRNLDWFDYWLQGRVDPDPTKAAQYRRWDALRALRDAVRVPTRKAVP